MEIEGIKLEEDHIDSKVTYIPAHAKGDASHRDSEGGTIKSWNDKFVFVNYGYNSKATPPELLVWG